jgi:hypothetical protein
MKQGNTTDRSKSKIPYISARELAGTVRKAGIVAGMNCEEEGNMGQVSTTDNSDSTIPA